MLVLALRDVAAVADGYTTNRAALFEQLRVNVEALADGRPEMSLAGDVADGTGVVYRHFPEHGYQFHPLASFIRLNNLARKGRARRRAGWPMRSSHAGSGAGRRSSGSTASPSAARRSGPRLRAGAGAQALARTGKLLGDGRLTEAAAACSRDPARPHPAGRRRGLIQEYSFSDTAILNAQLESTVALREYAELTGNEEAAAYVAGLSETTKSVLDEFDTGCWSLYSRTGRRRAACTTRTTSTCSSASPATRCTARRGDAGAAISTRAGANRGRRRGTASDREHVDERRREDDQEERR